MTISSPVIQIAGSSGQPLATGGEFSIGADYADLIANGNNAFIASNSKVFDLAAGQLSMASPAQIGAVYQGITVTAEMVKQNQMLLDAIGSYCIKNHIKIVVEAQLSNSPSQDWTYQWLAPAVTAKLPIVAVENDNELDYSPSSFIQNFGSIAADEVAIVKQIIAYYPDVQIGQWVGGGPIATAAEWWDTYDTAAKAAGLPPISYVVADTSWDAPWVTSAATWETTLQNLSTAAKADGMKLDVLLDGISTDASGSEWTAQSEQHAAMLAAVSNLDVNALRIESWTPVYPDAVLPINQPNTIGNDAAEIAATYPLYQAGDITAAGNISVSAPPQIITRQDNASHINGVSLIWDTAKPQPASQAAVVIMDETGQLSVRAFGNATISGNDTNKLILNGDSSDIAAELSTLSVYEPIIGPDSIDIEIFGENGRLENTQIQVLSLSGLAGAATGIINFSPASPLQTWDFASAGLNNGKIVSLSYTWAPSNYDSATGSYVVTNTISVHEPLAEAGVTYVNGAPEEPLANPSPGSAASLPFTMSAFNPSAYNPAASVVTLDVLASSLAYSISGQLDSVTETLAASNPVATITGASPVNYFSGGGIQVVEYNTKGNLGWQSAWGNQYHSVTTTYDSSGQILEQVFQGEAADQYYNLDNVYNPYTGQLWEQLQTAPPPQQFSSFVTGPEYVTQFNTGNNPNWDTPDWGNAAQATVTFQDYYATAMSTMPPVVSRANVTSTLAIGMIDIDGTIVAAATLTGSVAVSSGGSLGDDGHDATLTVPIMFSGGGTLAAAAGTTLALDGAVTDNGTLALDGNIDMPDFSNSGTIYANAGADTIGALSTNIWVSAGPSSALTFLGHMGAATAYGHGRGLLEGGAGGDNLLVADGGATTVLGSTGGSDTLIGAQGTVMIAATPNDLVFAASAGGNDTVFGAASGSDTLVGGNVGAATLVGSTGNDAMWGGAGHDILFGGTGNETLGGGNGDATVVAGTGSSTLVGGSGNQEFVGAASGQATTFSGIGNAMLFTGGGAMTVVLQNTGTATGTVVLQSGRATVWGANSSTDVYDVINGTAGGHDLIVGFKPGEDALNLFGYRTGSAQFSSASGNTSLALSDGTTITFIGLSPSQVAQSIHYG